MYHASEYQPSYMDGLEPEFPSFDITILFADPATIRARRVVKRSNARITGKYPGWKARRMLQWESPHERNAMRLLDACPAVVSFNEQPCEIHYVMHGEKRKHYPDLLVQGNHWKEFWEIKTRSDAEQPEVAERSAFMAKALPAYGYGYRIVLAEDLKLECRLKNAKRLLKLGRIDIPSLERERIRQMFFGYETLPLGALQFDDANPNLKRHIYRLILDGVLTVDMDKPFEDSTAIYWSANQQYKGEQSWASLISKKV